MVFDSRQQAGILLGEELRRRKISPDIVFGLARGGVAVAAEVARILESPLQTLIVRKVGAPGNPEFAVGAAAEEAVWWDEGTLKRLGLDERWQKRQILAKKLEISEYRRKLEVHENERRSAQIFGNLVTTKDSELKIVVLVDDGAATGISMMAAIGAIRTGVSRQSRETPDKNRIIVALPVAPPDAAAKIERQADETVILSVDPDFRAVGQYYREFNQVSWDEVRTLLQLNRETYVETHPGKTP